MGLEPYARTHSLMSCFLIAIERRSQGQSSQPFDIPHWRFAKLVARQRPPDPIGELLLVGLHAAGLSFAGSLHRISRRNPLRRSPDPAETRLGGLYKHLLDRYTVSSHNLHEVTPIWRPKK